MFIRRPHGALAAWRLAAGHEWAAIWVTADRLAIPLRIGPEQACIHRFHERLPLLDVADPARPMPAVIIAGQRRAFGVAAAMPLLGVVDVGPGESVLLGVVNYTFVMVHVCGGRTTLLAHDAAALGEVNADLLLRGRRGRVAASPRSVLQLPDAKTMEHLHRLEHGSTAPREITALARKYVRIGLERLPDRIPMHLPFREVAQFVAGFLLQIASGARDFIGCAPSLLAEWRALDPTFEARLLALSSGTRSASDLLARGLAVLAQHTSLVVKEGGRTWRIGFSRLTNPNSERFRAFIAEIPEACQLDEVSDDPLAPDAAAAHPEQAASGPRPTEESPQPPGPGTREPSAEDATGDAPSMTMAELLAENLKLREAVRDLSDQLQEVRAREADALELSAAPATEVDASSETPATPGAATADTMPGHIDLPLSEAAALLATPCAGSHADVLEQNEALERLAEELSCIVVNAVRRAVLSTPAVANEPPSASSRGPPDT